MRTFKMRVWAGFYALLTFGAPACGGEFSQDEATPAVAVSRSALSSTRSIETEALRKAGPVEEPDTGRVLSSMSDVALLAADIEKAPTPAAALALVPAIALAEQPELADLIRGIAVPAAPPPSGPPYHSGYVIPPAPAAGLALLPGLPAPYGKYAINPSNNWSLPNNGDNGCTGVPDYGLTFDFRAACRQHDLAYQFCPAKQRPIDNQFYADMKAECARRSAVARPFCYAVAGAYYGGVRSFGAMFYCKANLPGYNRPGSPSLPAPPTCAQPTHAWVDTGGLGLTLRRGTKIILTGVVRKNSHILFQFRDRTDALVAEHVTYFSQDNCVVHHETELFDTGHLPTGAIKVTATYPRWEAAQTETAVVANLRINP